MAVKNKFGYFKKGEILNGSKQRNGCCDGKLMAKN